MWLIIGIGAIVFAILNIVFSLKQNQIYKSLRK